MKFADRLVGKGLGTWVVIKLITYNLAWMVVLVVPMAVLVATLMAFGGMSQNNEITVMKSSGVSLYKMMLGPVICSLLLAYGLIVFNNDVLPDANHAAKNLMQDISSKKPTLSLVPGVFSQEVANYAILVRDIDQNSNKLFQVTIYDYTNPQKINVVTAKKGIIYFSADQTKLLMDLENGEIHESDVSETTMYRKLIFNNHRISMNASQFSFQQSGFGGQRSDRELSANDMLSIVDSLKDLKENYDVSFKKIVNTFFIGDSFVVASTNKSSAATNKNFIYNSLIEKVRSTKNSVLSAQLRVDDYQKEINKFMVEVHKKYSIPVACLIFILLGSPLGVIARKGGFGIAASISLFFFLLYWASLIGGEKLADRAIISPWLGMWTANIVMGFLGFVLTVRAAKEAVLIDFKFYKKLIPKSWRQEEETNEDN